MSEELENQMSSEEMAERKAKLKDYYTEEIEFLKVRLEYETLVTLVEEQRAKRVQYQVMIANMLASEPEEEEEEQEPNLSKRTLKKS
jgi:hypothetical protein